MRYRLKSPHRDGTTHLVLEPLDFIARLAAPVPPPPRQVAMTWARRLKRVFGIAIQRCARCSGRLEIIVSIEEPAVVARILAHRRERDGEESPASPPGPRAPPGSALGMLI